MSGVDFLLKLHREGRIDASDINRAQKSPRLPPFSATFFCAHSTTSVHPHSSPKKSYFKQMLLKGKTTTKKLWNKSQQHSYKWGSAPANL